MFNGEEEREGIIHMSENNVVKVFSNSEFGELGVLVVEGKEMFPATDCAKMLKYSNPNKAVIDHCRYLTKREVPHPQNPNRVIMKNYIPEGDLYRLVIRSKKPEAEKFERWITHEVLPAIRKTGGYIAGEESMSDEELLSKALMIANNKIQLRDEQIKNLAETNVQLLPKAEYYDALVERNLLTGIRETAKELKIGERKFVRMLLENGYVFRTANGNLMPYANKNNGLFEVKEGSNSRSGWFGTFMMVTPKGRNKLRLLVTESAA